MKNKSLNFYIPCIKLKKEKSSFKKIKIINISLAYKLIKQFYFDDIDIYESVFILLLDQANQSIGYAKISQGGISGTAVDPRIIYKYAIESLACSVILCHNHPSGNLNASIADIKITNKIKEGLNLLDIKLLDHIIINKTNYKSILK